MPEEVEHTYEVVKTETKEERKLRYRKLMENPVYAELLTGVDIEKLDGLCSFCKRKQKCRDTAEKTQYSENGETVYCGAWVSRCEEDKQEAEVEKIENKEEKRNE